MAKSTTSSFWDHPIVKIEEALHIRKQIEALQAKLHKLIGEKSEPATLSALKKKTMTASKAKKPSVTVTAKKAVVITKKKKGGITPEGRAKLAASMKARWAAKKKTAAKA